MRFPGLNLREENYLDSTKDLHLKYCKVKEATLKM